MFSCSHSYLFTCLHGSGGEAMGGYASNHHPSHVSATDEDRHCGHTPCPASLQVTTVIGFHGDLADTTSNIVLKSELL